MTNPEELNINNRLILEEEAGNTALRGFFRDGSGQLWFDRRYTFAAIQSSTVLTPRNADVNLIGLRYLAVSDDLAAELGYNGT